MKFRLGFASSFDSYSSRAKWVTYPTLVLFIVSFVVFLVGSVYLGGDALNGHARNGHYFLCAHGHCTEVSRATWQYSYWHCIALIGNLLLVFGETALFLETGDIRWK